MALGLLWLGLSLLGTLQAETQDPAPKLVPAPRLSRIPVQPNFQDDQFQGKWYVVGLAGNAISQSNEDQSTMYTTNYELKEDRSYNVTSTLFRNERCDYFVRTFVQSSRPGQFYLGNIKAYPNVRRYIVRVVATDYTQYAMVFFKNVLKKQTYFKITLYGRTKELPQELRENFSRFSKSLGLADDNIVFPVPIDRCIDDQ